MFPHWDITWLKKRSIIIEKLQRILQYLGDLSKNEA
jgi:hypothetical protein